MTFVRTPATPRKPFGSALSSLGPPFPPFGLPANQGSFHSYLVSCAVGLIEKGCFAAYHAPSLQPLQIIRIFVIACSPPWDSGTIWSTEARSWPRPYRL